MGSTPEGVSCGSPTVCTIVGLNYNGGLVVRLAGASTQLQPAAPAPGNAANVELKSASCTHATCMAVGDYPDEANTSRTLAEQYR